jgi:hypothetical protein
MGRQPQRHPEHVDALLSIRVPGWLKNEIADQAAAAGVSISSYLGAIVHRVARRDLGMPDPPPAKAPVPDVSDVLRAYATGQPILTPCGQRETCQGLDMEAVKIGSVRFCAACDIRLS